MTRQNAHLFLPLAQALADGKIIQVQHYDTKEWRDWGWGAGANSDFRFDESHPPDCYRIKPDPVMIPLGPEDVPPGSAIRYKLSTAPEPYWMIGSVSSESIDIHTPRGFTKVTWYRALSEMEIKRPGEDWQPCCKPAPES